MNLGINLQTEIVFGKLQNSNDIELGPSNIKINRGGKIPQESARRIKALLSIAAAISLSCCYTLFFKNSRLSLAEYHTETTALANGTTEQRLYIKYRWDRLCFQMPVTGKFYIALTMHSFNDYICHWIGNFYYCYILHSRSINKTFESFQGQLSWTLSNRVMSSRSLPLAVKTVFSMTLLWTGFRLAIISFLAQMIATFLNVLSVTEKFTNFLPYISGSVIFPLKHHTCTQAK